MNSAHHVGDLAQYRPRLLWHARSRLFNPAHAEDVVQETLLAAIQGFDKYAGDASLFSWLMGILKHKIVDCVRRSAKEQWHEIDNDGTPLDPEMREPADYGEAAAAQRSWSDPVHALTHRRMLEALDCCLRQLPERTAQTYVLREVMGFDTTEASQALAVSEANCSIMLHRARNRIRESIDPEWLPQ